MTEPDIQWAIKNIPNFKKFKEQADAAKASTEEYRKRFANCPRANEAA